MGIQGMKVHHHLPRGLWQHHPPPTLRCHRRLRPLAPKLSSAASHLKSFIKPAPRKPSSDHLMKELSPQVDAQPGGTRWNPTQEQISYLEMLYRGGIRTPNAQQIEHITAHLAKYGKIEGKNVFYWFQNHKARERQKQKRISLVNNSCATPKTTSTAACLVSSPTQGGKVLELESRYCTEGEEEEAEEEEEDEEEEEGEIRTLKLFPLHPERRA